MGVVGWVSFLPRCTDLHWRTPQTSPRGLPGHLHTGPWRGHEPLDPPECLELPRVPEPNPGCGYLNQIPGNHGKAPLCCLKWSWPCLRGPLDTQVPHHRKNQETGRRLLWGCNNQAPTKNLVVCPCMFESLNISISFHSRSGS